MALFIDEATVRRLLPMADAIEDVQKAFIARANGTAFDIPRQRTRLPGGHLHILQGAALDLDLVGYKAYYSLPNKPISTLLHLYSRSSGAQIAVIESNSLSQIRTGAATGVAARSLARKNAKVVGLFGSGRHAVTQLQAVCAVFDVSEVKVFGRDQQKLAAFCQRMGEETGKLVRPAASREETVRGSDIVVIMTKASEPVFDGKWVEPGQFIAATGGNALDRREIDQATVQRADVLVVDSREVAERESGDLLSSAEAGLLHFETLPDMGDVLIGRRPGRTSDDQITLYESHGMAIQDLYTGHRILQAARAQGLGTALPFGA